MDSSSTTDIINRAKQYIADEHDAGFKAEVEKLIASGDAKELEDRFYRDLEFGTGGLRGVIGGGTNRMNTYVINKATQGLANYFKKIFPDKAKTEGGLKAVVAFDSRRYSREFAEATALIFAANGFKTYLFSSMRPTPELSFAIRTLGCDTGVVVTASHNPPQYNGYKAYWTTGVQVIEPHDEGIITEVGAVQSVKTISKDEALKKGLLNIIDKEIDELYWKMVTAQLFRPELIRAKANEVKVVYTPLHGTGAMHVEKVLGDLGLTVITVPEQKEGNGEFPTVEKPNPEEAPAMKMAIDLAKKEKADVVMATDPDADRFGTAFPDKNGNYVLVTGNQMGALLTDYVCLSKKEKGLPKNPAIIRSIVTSSFSDKIAAHYGIKTIECLTGFKWIGSVMDDFEKSGDSYIFGFEESYGYLVEKDIRDKDGISAAAMCAEMTLYWRSQGKSLLERLNELYTQFGYHEDRAISKNFPGSAGNAQMADIMKKLRADGLKNLGGKKVVMIRDIQESVSYDPYDSGNSAGAKQKLALPKSNVLQFFLEGGTVVSARPSGTEPKIKFYINAALPAGNALEASRVQVDGLCAAITAEINSVLG
ncbi:MAG: phospho-sugar mutase [Treponemataceae bacterium]|nr:MAG: phospho-sugar mutase [Treponemataceae bacterium]